MVQRYQNFPKEHLFYGKFSKFKVLFVIFGIGLLIKASFHGYNGQNRSWMAI